MKAVTRRSSYCSSSASLETSEVTELVGDKPKVKCDGQSRAFTWAYVEHASGGSDKKDDDKKDDKKEAPKSGGKYSVGDRVRVRDTDRAKKILG